MSDEMCKEGSFQPELMVTPAVRGRGKLVGRGWAGVEGLRLQVEWGDAGASCVMCPAAPAPFPLVSPGSHGVIL